MLLSACVSAWFGLRGIRIDRANPTYHDLPCAVSLPGLRGRGLTLVARHGEVAHAAE